MTALGIGLGLPFTRARGGAAGPSVFTDNFERADENLDASENWMTAVGTASHAQVESNNLSLFAAGDTNTRILCPDLGWADHYAESTRLSTTDSAWVAVVRQGSDGSFFGARRDAGNWQMWRRVGGSFTLIGSAANPSPAAGQIQRLSAVGDQITFRIDGNIVIGPVTDAAHSTNTRAGVVSRTSNFVSAMERFEHGVL